MPNYKPNMALVLSGGGLKGAFQVGVMDELITNKGVSFDTFAGVSTGALQALAGAQDQVPDIVSLWTDLRKQKDLFKTRTWGIFGGVFKADSKYNNDPLKNKIDAFVDKDRLIQTGKKLLVGVTCLQTGAYSIHDEKDPELAEKILASTCVPFAFKPVQKKFDDGRPMLQFVDGGVRNITPLADVLKVKPSAIVIVLASPRKARKTKTKKFNNMFSIAMRSVELITNEIFLNDIRNIDLINQFVSIQIQMQTAAAALPISAADKQELLRPLNEAVTNYGFVPIEVIEPNEVFYDAHDFDRNKIHFAMEEGRKKVKARWIELENFLKV